jgi:DNA-binding IclR family transcriptional regulator
VITVAEPIDADALRIRHEFLSRPGLQATVSELAAGLELRRHHALAALESLVSEGFLARAPDGGYVRAAGADPCVPR